MGKQFGKAADVAELLDISEQTAWRLAREGKLPPGTYVRLNGRSLRFDLAAIRRWIASGAGGANGASGTSAQAA